jgi:hypothetical protein
MAKVVVLFLSVITMIFSSGTSIVTMCAFTEFGQADDWFGLYTLIIIVTSFSLTASFFMNIDGAMSTLAILWAEDPQSLAINRPEHHQRLYQVVLDKLGGGDDEITISGVA